MPKIRRRGVLGMLLGAVPASVYALCRGDVAVVAVNSRMEYGDPCSRCGDRLSYNAIFDPAIGEVVGRCCASCGLLETTDAAGHPTGRDVRVVLPWDREYPDVVRRACAAELSRTHGG